MCHHAGEDAGDAAGEELDAHGQQDDAEELAQHVDDVGAQAVGDLVEEADDKVVEHDIEQQTDEDVDGGILGAERDEGRDSAGSSDEGEGHRHHAGAARGAVVLDDLAAEHHLQRQDEEHQGASHGEGGRVDAEEAQQAVADEVEGHEEQQCHHGGLQGLDGLALLAHGDEDGDRARDVDDGEHHQEGAEYLNKIDLL